MTSIAELIEDRTVEGVYAVARKQRLRTRGGAPYLALELVDPSGRIDARVWHDVELLDSPDPSGEREADEVGWKTAMEAAPYLLDPEAVERELTPRDLFAKLQPFKKLVAEDIEKNGDG